MDLPIQIGTVVAFCFVFLSLFFGYINSRMNMIYHHYEAKNSRYLPNNNYLVKKGALPYLEEQLNLKNKQEVVQAINDTSKYHGKWQEINSEVAQCQTNHDFWKVLNPVVEACQSGSRYRPEALKANFKTYNMADIPVPLKFNNLLVVSYNSKDNQDIQTLNNFVKNNPDVQLLAFDNSTQGGKTAFKVPMYNFLNQGNQVRQGYNPKKNAWTGTAYGFTDNNLSYHTKNLQDLNNLKGIPHKSLYDPSIVNQINQPIQDTTGD